jgi:DNA-binding transcriptional LysR family regulator
MLIVLDVDLRHLRCFVAVAEELHFGRAAQRLHIAQPAVSQTIAGLERELGLTLFERTNRRVLLTDGARALLPDARAVLERAAVFAEAAQGLRSGAVGRVTIGVSPALPPRVLTDVLAIARAEAPDVRVVAKSLTRPDAGAALVDSQFDLVLARGAVSEAGVASILVASETVGLALPADHPLAALDAVPASALNGEPLATFPRTSDPATFDRIFGTLRAAGLTDVGELHESPVGAVEASLRLVAAGEALSLKLPSEVESFADPRIAWRPLADVHLDVHVHVAWRFDMVGPAARRVVNALRASVEQRGS